MHDGVREAWDVGTPYEQFIGRWSRLVGREFLAWLNAPSGQTWGDVGCGTGALLEGILATSQPQAVFAIDRSKGFLGAAQSTISDRRVGFAVADATSLPWANASCDTTVSGLVLNFVPNPVAMVREMVRVTRPRGQVALYVWDYRSMEMLRQFWDAAVEVTPADAPLDEARRFPLCQPEPLQAVFRDGGLTSIAVHSIAVPTLFRDFDDYWTPFLGKQGPAPTYLASLDGEAHGRIQEILKARLVAASDGTIALTAHAWAVQGAV